MDGDIFGDRCSMCYWGDFIPVSVPARANGHCGFCPRLPDVFAQKLVNGVCEHCAYNMGGFCDEYPELFLSEAVQVCGHCSTRRGFALKIGRELMAQGTLSPGVKEEKILLVLSNLKKALELLEGRESMWAEMFARLGDSV
jgi:hypothetical protein